VSEDEAFAELSRRVVRVRGLVGGIGMLGGFALGLGLYLLLRESVTSTDGARMQYDTMVGCMVVALPSAWVVARTVGRAWVAARLPSWIDELARQHATERARLAELATIWR
jgi:hypothetical protein